MKGRSSILFPLVTGIAFLALPLVRELHYESALITAVVVSFWAGIRFSRFRSTTDAGELLVIVRGILLMALPPFVYSLLIGCLSVDGFLFWLLYPFPSLLFSAAFGRFFRILLPRFALSLTLLVILFTGVGVLLAELKLFPQVYFFNHIWGGVPGPIYDEEVTAGRSLFLFRLLTLSWALLIWNLPAIRLSRVSMILSVMCLLMLSMGYTRLPEWGIISPRSYLKQQLTLHISTDHVDLYLDGERYTEAEALYWAEKHEFYIAEITRLLEIEWPDGRRIESYLYAHAWQKKELVGAKFTSYVPVWQDQDQLHIAKEHLNVVLKHELVHVIAKQFGNRLINASFSIGLIEGLAEGIAGDASPVSTLDQILAANPPYPDAERMRRSLSWRGFYSDAAAISYTTAGSFVRYLMKEYPVSNLKEAYRLSDPEAAYPVPFDTLVAGWIRTLPVQELDETDRAVSQNVFAQRSVFEKSCPHSPGRLDRMWDDWQYARASEQDSLAYKRIRGLYDAFPEIPRIQQEWAVAAIMNGDADSVVLRPLPVKEPFLHLLKADALMMTGAENEAITLRDSVQAELGDKLSQSMHLNLALRSNRVNWMEYLAIRYGDPDTVSDSATVDTIVRFRLMYAFASSGNTRRLAELADDFTPASTDQIPFDWYEEITDRLIFSGSCNIAMKWLKAAETMSLRLREEERLVSLQEALQFRCDNNTVYH